MKCERLLFYYFHCFHSCTLFRRKIEGMMTDNNPKKHLTVAPFECVWSEDLRFKEAGRGCVSFEAFAQNDITLVFREHVGSQHYHYRMDKSPNYTIIFGSHRNRRLKIVVDGKTVVDVAGIGLCTSFFQTYWIGICDGLISVGKGKQSFQELVVQWLDLNPNRCSIHYVGLSSWDKHVRYKNVNVFQISQNHNCLQNEYKIIEGECSKDWCLEEWKLDHFLENWVLSDMFFIVDDGRKVPGHKVILGASGTFNFNSSDKDIINLPSVAYLVLHAFLEYIYTGRTQIMESQIGYLHDLSMQFQVHPLTKQCERVVDGFTRKLLKPVKKVELIFYGSQDTCDGFYPIEIPVNHKKLQQFFEFPKYNDVNIYTAEHGFVAASHKIILSLWSTPFNKMFTNGMVESTSSEVIFGDIPAECFQAMLQFIYTRELASIYQTNLYLLVPLLLLADQFGVASLHRVCCQFLLDCLSEDTVCTILRAVSSLPSCKLLEEACLRKFSMQFDYCTTVSTQFVSIEVETFTNILQHPDLTVTSEEKVLDAVLIWCMQADEICSWEKIDGLLHSSAPQLFFRERYLAMHNMMSYIRFPIMPHFLLEKLAKSRLCRQIPIIEQLVTEAMHHLNYGTKGPEVDLNIKFQHRRSGFKELRYLCDGDNNGVMYFAGTSYGEHQWVNPVLSKKVNVTASSPPSRYTDAKALTSRAYHGTSFAGPRMENDQFCTWWMVDLGEDHQLMCNHYTLRQDGSTAYIRSWALQGSSDIQTWTNMRVHENDSAIGRPGQFSSWPVHGTAALLPLRYFRILLMAPTTDASNPWNLSICFLELYGFFR